MKRNTSEVLYCREVAWTLKLFLPRSSRSKVFCEKVVLKHFAIFTEKHLCWSLQLIEKKVQDRCFPVNIAKFLGTSVLMNICERCFFLSNVPFWFLLKMPKNLLFKPWIVPIILCVNSKYISAKHKCLFNNSSLTMKILVINKVHRNSVTKLLPLLKKKNVLLLGILQMKRKSLLSTNLYLVHS